MADPAGSSAQVEMSTIMEGFRYVKNDNTVYPITKGEKMIADFPIIPIGMLDIWREQNDEGDIEAMLKM